MPFDGFIYALGLIRMSTIKNGLVKKFSPDRFRDRL